MLKLTSLSLTAPLVLAALGFAQAAAADKLSYNRDIRPILSDNCFACHGPDQAKRDSGLRLDIREEAIKPAESGDIAIVAGKPDASELLVRVFSTDRDDQMPPPKAHKILTAAQKELLKRWVTEGAVYEPHWAYTRLVRPEVPQIAAASQVRNPIDAFIQQRLAAREVAPAPEADRRTLIRRLALDLTGIPPRPEEVERFAHDAKPAAYERLVDHLLASPHYGERMAQQWLDLARYADTVGFHGDQNQNVWAYRDWVIAAFNANQPFDQFTIEQLAGDLLPNPTPEQLTATAFNRLNMMTREGGAQPKEYLAKSTADRLRTVGTAWLGSTLGCAECHDHKFDPWSQKDVYAIGAFFADVKQWGVYADYRYTPNPDLLDFGNEHPFPPELIVPSAALERRIQAVRERMAATVRSVEAPAEQLAAWQAEVSAFLVKNPSGWETPAATITVKPTKPEAAQTKDGRIVVELRPQRDLRLELQPSAGWLAALKIELLPEAKSGDRILRGAGGEMEKPAFEIVRKDGKAQPLAMRHAQADRSAPRYNDGAEVIGVKDAWKLDPSYASKPHTAIYFPEQPVRLAAGDLMRVRFPSNQLTSLRVSTSQLAPLNVQQPAFPQDLGAAVTDAKTAREFFLRSTAWHAEAFASLKKADAEYLACRDGKTPVLITERTDKPLTVRVLPRGNWQDESGEIVQPETPHFLPKLPDATGRQLTRLDLARWLVSAENPLTARVVMNRLWRQFFGVALSAQVDDLGAQGESPSHPELLDWLAVEFREPTAAQPSTLNPQLAWDLKRMAKLLVMSHTYRQVAGLRSEVRESDPQNRLLAAQNPRRLEAEFVRDNALAVAGLLDLEIGGPPSRPYQPAEYYADLQFPSREYVADTDASQWRRGVYMWWQRTTLHPMLQNFDAPSREDCIAMRTIANTPQQALTLLNDPTFVEAARAWAAKLLVDKADDSQRLESAYQQALARAPRPEEKASLLAALAKARKEYRAQKDDAPKLLKVGFASTTNADPAELAAWTTVCRVILNLHETITRY